MPERRLQVMISVGAAVLAIAVLALGWWTWPRGVATRGGTDGAVDRVVDVDPAPGRTEPVPTADAKPGGTASAEAPEARRVRIPKPPPRRSADEPVPQPISRIAGLEDKRPPEDQGFVDRELLTAGLDAVRDDIAECIDQWTEVTPELAGEVMLVFELDENGLEEAWVEDVVDVPAGPLSCFASAVYDLDWSEVTDDPLEVSQRYVVEIRPDDDE